MAQILTRTYSGEVDSIIKLDNEQIGRPMFFGSNWNRIRVGFRYTISGSVGTTAYPYCYLGVCSGTSSMVGAATCSNFIGIRWVEGTNIIDNTTSWSQQVGNPFQVCRVVSGSLSASVQGLITQAHGKPTASRTMMIMDIEKGTPSYTMSLVAPTLAGIGDISLATLTASMLYPTYSYGVPVGGYDAQTRYIPFTEDSGSLDTVNIWWRTSSHPIELSDIVVMKIF